MNTHEDPSARTAGFWVATLGLRPESVSFWFDQWLIGSATPPRREIAWVALPVVHPIGQRLCRIGLRATSMTVPSRYSMTPRILSSNSTGVGLPVSFWPMAIRS